MRVINYISGIQGVGPGNVATLNLTPGRRYHALKCFVSGTFNSATSFDPAELIASVRLIANGVVIRDLLPADVINIAKLNNITPSTANGELPFFFSEPWRATIQGEEATSWDLIGGGVQTLTLEVTFNSVSVTGSFAITNLACAVEAAFDYGRNFGTDGKPLLNIIKQLRTTRAVPSGQSDIIDLPAQLPIQRIHLRTSTGAISAIEVYNNSVKVLEGLLAQINTFYKDYKITGTFFGLSTVFDYSQQLTDALFVANNNLDVRITCASANTLTAIVEQRAPGFVG
jgi:hypothetical protein